MHSLLKVPPHQARPYHSSYDKSPCQFQDSFLFPAVTRSLCVLAASSFLSFSLPVHAAPDVQSDSAAVSAGEPAHGDYDVAAPDAADLVLPEPKNIDAGSEPENERVSGSSVVSKETAEDLMSSGSESVSEDSEQHSAAPSGEARAVNGTTLNSEKSGFGTQRSGALASGGLASPAGIINWLLSTIAILGVIFALAWLLRRSRLVQRSMGGSMHLITQMAVGPKERLVQVRAASRVLLVGVTAHSVNLVADLTDSEKSESKNTQKKSNSGQSGFNCRGNAGYNAQDNDRYNESSSAADSAAASLAQRYSPEEIVCMTELFEEHMRKSGLNDGEQERRTYSSSRLTDRDIENRQTLFRSVFSRDERRSMGAGHEGLDSARSSAADRSADRSAALSGMRRNGFFKMGQACGMPDDDILHARASRAKKQMRSSAADDADGLSGSAFSDMLAHEYEKAHDSLNMNIIDDNDLSVMRDRAASGEIVLKEINPDNPDACHPSSGSPASAACSAAGAAGASAAAADTVADASSMAQSAGDVAGNSYDFAERFGPGAGAAEAAIRATAQEKAGDDSEDCAQAVKIAPYLYGENEREGEDASNVSLGTAYKGAEVPLRTSSPALSRYSIRRSARIKGRGSR